jgi:tetratricopeptide (TPR) repeat protein
MRIQRNVPEYNLAMGECKMELGKTKEAIQHFGLVVRSKPKFVAGWESLIRCLYKGGYFEEASAQSLAALEATDNKPVFFFYHSAALFGDGRAKEALLQLEKGMMQVPKMLKKFLELQPAALQNNQVVDLIARYKKARKM